MTVTLTQAQRIELNQKMNETFSLSEIDGICYDLGINAEDIPGNNKSSKVRELIQYCERRDRVGELSASLQSIRPKEIWPGVEIAGDAAAAGTTNTTSKTQTPTLPIAPIAPKKITILFLASNPKDTERLRLDEEVRTIDERLRLSQHRDTFTLAQQWAVRTGDILDAMLRYKPDIVHFSGHGSQSGDLIFEDASGAAKPVSAAALGALFAARKAVRCVVMNACWSDVHADAITKAVDCVVGMTRSVGDDAAINFASGFYRSLGEGLSVGEAFDLGKVQILLDGGDDEETTPRLRVKANTDATRVTFA